MPIATAPIERWFARVSINTDSNCWELPLSERIGSEMKYPILMEGRKAHRAHRLAYEHYKGEIPDGMCVLHRCDNPACSNPDHLFLGTRTENMADKVRKDRQQKGSKVHLAKLDESLIPKIRALRDNGMSQSNIAALFGVHQSQISRILNNKRWKHCADL